MAERLTVAVLGTGAMGAPMARRILGAGHAVRAWNRTRARAEPLAADGAVVAGSPAEAADGADVLVTMLTDGPAVESAVAEGVLRPALTWLQTSTVGVRWTETLAARANEAGVHYLDAPVVGTVAPAEQGRLVVLAAGDDEAAERGAPVLEAIGRTTIRLGAVGDATRLKLVLNGALLAYLAGLGEAIALAEAFGLGGDRLLDAIEGGPIDTPYAKLKGPMMVERSYEPSFALDLALKDLRLELEAAREEGVELRVAEVVAAELERASALGYGEADMAAVIEAVRAGRA
jgi:3-hydroxyisobutyrate dehydrogenase